ncbi:MAG: multicopper oxidase family protein [Acidobacteriaceae bacterium]
MLTRRRFAQLTAMTSASMALGRGLTAQMEMPAGQSPPSAPPIPANASPADFTLDIAPYLLEASPKHRFQTVAYNGQVPGPLLRMRQGRPIAIDIHNHSANPEIVHCHGLFLPVPVDGAIEEGSPMIAPGASTRIAFTPEPAGFRWFHTHAFAGNDLHKGLYSGQHGFIMIDPAGLAGQPAYDREVFLGLHDWGGRLMPSGDGSAMPMYDVSTINGKMLGFGEPIRVKQGERILMHILNSSPTEVHWIALAGHSFQVVALDGNPIARPQTVDMLCLASAERVSAIVQMNAPGVWVLGEVRKHVQAAGMGIVVEYANATGAPKWIQPPNLVWDYARFADAAIQPTGRAQDVIDIPLVFDSKFQGHGNPERWTINGKSYPNTESPTLQAGKRYRLVMKNLSNNDHPIHLHRHTFEVTRVGGQAMRGLMKDVLLIPAKNTSTVEFDANLPGNTLFHCHQQDHMDHGFMMVFHYA